MFTFLSLLAVISNADKLGKTASMAIGCTVVAAKAVSEAAYYLAQSKAYQDGDDLLNN